MISRVRVTRAPGPVLQGLVAFALYLVVFVVAAGLPLARHLNVPDLRQYWTDVQFYIWSMGWWPHAVSHGVNPLFSGQIGAPHGYSLAWASTAPSVDLAMWPVTAAFGVVASYNIMLLLVPPVSAWAAFVAARRLTGRFWPSLAAGTVYGFCPYELVHTWQGQPNLTVIALFPLLVYLVLRWWDGTLGRTWFVIWAALALAVQFYTFNEGFFDLTAVLVGSLVIGFAIAGRGARRRVARLAGLTAIAYVGAVILSAPYLFYSLRHYQAALSRGNPEYSLPLIRLVVPEPSQLFGLAPLANYSSQFGRGSLDDYVGIPLILIVVLLAGFAWRSRISWLLQPAPGLFAALGETVEPAGRAQRRALTLYRLRRPGARARPGPVAGRARPGQAAAGSALGPRRARDRGDPHGLAHVLPGDRSGPAVLYAAGHHAAG
jgi:hypothetical protein